MLTVKNIVEYICPGNWFTSVDLKDAYSYAPTIHMNRKVPAFLLPARYNIITAGYSLVILWLCTPSVNRPEMHSWWVQPWTPWLNRRSGG